jgi:SPP1 gp7 family putative phage head morphogenesis protein
VISFEEFRAHYGAPGADAFDVPPEDAITFFRAKGLVPTFAWQDMIGEEHAHAFTIAKMLDVDLLADVRASLDAAIADGTPYDEWARKIEPMLRARGWWGRDADGNLLGTPWRLQTIFRTNAQSAYAAGQWEQIADSEDELFAIYDAVDDHRTRPEHAAWDGIVAPVGSRWLRMHTPPCGWNCRCGLIYATREEVEALGLQVTDLPRVRTYEWENPRTGEKLRVPVGVDPGFGLHPEQRGKRAEQLLLEKVAALPADMRSAARDGIAAAKAQAAQTVGASVTALPTPAERRSIRERLADWFRGLLGLRRAA